MSGMDWDLLDRYLARECSAEERVRVERWMAEAPSNRRRVELLSEATVTAPATPRTAVWELIERQLDAPRKSFSLGSRPAQSSLTKVAIVLLVLGVGALAGRAVFSPRPEPSTTAPAMRVVTTPPGQRASFRLPDGTSVMLGVASTLRHPVGFGGGRREVELEGEAYFEVVHDENRPFAVRAADVVAEDLGTQFLVRAYREDRHARVVVREGRVALRAASAQDASAQQVLLPGQLGRLERNGTPVAERVDTSAYFAWTQGRLVFDDVALRDALPQLSRWYDLEFRLADSALGGVPLTATFRNQPTEDVLDLLAASLGMRQVRSGRTVTFYSATSGR
jgi:transmembrane sensor